jgi:uncharacterized protein (DUF1778 family)
VCQNKNTDVQRKIRRKGETVDQKQTQRILTKKKQVTSNYRMTQQDRDLMLAACTTCGESRSEFLRTAVRQRALEVLGRQQKLAG